jgi:hypothetical protein
VFKFGGVEPTDSKLPLVNNLISNIITDINKQLKKPAQIPFN